MDKSSAKKKKERKRQLTVLLEWALLIIVLLIVAIICFRKPQDSVSVKTNTEITAETNNEVPVKPEAEMDSESNEEIDSETIEQPSVELVQRAEADYEKWLAATMIISISMEYSDFELEEIYAMSATALEEKENSEGVYILFTSQGVLSAVYSVPLDKERTEAGTKDISAQLLGFATFDEVDPTTIDLSEVTKIEVEELEELISQSMLVSVYKH